MYTPISFGPYRLEDTTIHVGGPPDLDAASGAVDFLAGCETRLPFWLGDLYRHVKQEFPSTYSQLFSSLEIDPDTLQEYARVAAAVAPERRLTAQGVSWVKHQAVAALDPDDQQEILAAAHGLKLSEVRQRVRKLKRAKQPESTGELRGMYRVVYADPPYDALSMAEIAAVPVAAHMQLNSVCFLWHPESKRFEVKQVLDEWGFVHRTSIIWDLVDHQKPGHWVDERHRYLLIATRGTCPADNLVNEKSGHMVDSVQTFRRNNLGVDLPAPREFQAIIEGMYDRGPYLRVFSREDWDGWTCCGHHIGEKVA